MKVSYKKTYHRMTKSKSLLFLGSCNIKLEEDDIPILHHIGLTLLSILPCSLQVTHSFLTPTQLLEIIKITTFSLDEPSLKVRMDDPSSLRGSDSFHYGPAPNFLLPSSEVIHQVQFCVTYLDYFRQRTSPPFQLFQELFCTVFISSIFQPLEFLFKLNTKRDG